MAAPLLLRLSCAALAVSCVAVGAGCTPALNWRAVQPSGGAVQAMFPCKPDQVSRRVPLANQTLEVALASCTAAGATFALTQTDVADPRRVAEVLRALREALNANFQATPSTSTPYAVPGMTPNAQVVRVRLQGMRPDGKTVPVQAVFFVHATRVHQATVVGEPPDPDAADTFFAGLKIPS